MTEADNVQALAENALETFDLMEYVSGTVTAPEDSTTVYLDTATAYEIYRLTQQYEAGVVETKDGPKGITDEADDEALKAQIHALQDKIKASGLTVYMRAMNEPEREILRKKVERANPIAKNAEADEKEKIDTKREEDLLEEWLSRAALKIVRPDGAVVNDVSIGHIQALKTTLWDSEWDKLPALFGKLSFARGLVDNAIDAGFPGGETVPA